MKTNHEWTRINTNRPELLSLGDRWGVTCPHSTRILQAAPKCFCNFVPVGVTLSWDDAHPGARASRPHKAWHSLGHLPHLDQPGTAPWLSFGLAAAVPAHRVAACSIALKLSGSQRDRMRAGRPRSQGITPPLRAESQKPSSPGEGLPMRGGGYPAGDFSESRPVPFGKLPFACEPGARPPRLGGSIESETTDLHEFRE